MTTTETQCERNLRAGTRRPEGFAGPGRRGFLAELAAPMALAALLIGFGIADPGFLARATWQRCSRQPPSCWCW